MPDPVPAQAAEQGTACVAEPLDGHEHAGDLIEYVGICVRGHVRRGLVCVACAPSAVRGGPAAVTCAECPDDDPRPRVLIPAERWDELGDDRD